MYDLDSNGKISRDEMTTIVKAFYKFVTYPHFFFIIYFNIFLTMNTFSGEKYASPDHLVNEFFTQMDTNKDGDISLEEYKKGAALNPEIMQGLQFFN